MEIRRQNVLAVGVLWTAGWIALLVVRELRKPISVDRVTIPKLIQVASRTDGKRAIAKGVVKPFVEVMIALHMDGLCVFQGSPMLYQSARLADVLLMDGLSIREFSRRQSGAAS